MEKNLTETEQWKPLIDYVYGMSYQFKISSFGNIVPADPDSGCSVKLGQRRLSIARQIQLINKHRKIKYKVAELVALAFLPPCYGEIGDEPRKYTIDFKDENRSNARANNLFWIPYEIWAKKNKSAVRKERYLILPGSKYSINARFSPQVCQQMAEEADLTIDQIAEKYDIPNDFAEMVARGGWRPLHVPPEACDSYKRLSKEGQRRYLDIVKTLDAAYV